MTKELAGALSKVPEVTLGFWIIKILATTLGETGGDSVTMSMNLGYAVGSFIFLGIFLVAVIAQIAAKNFHPFLYWVTIVATTTLGTTMADFFDRSLGIGYFGGSSILLRGTDGFARSLALVGRLDLRQYRRDAEGRVVLLGGDPVLADARHRAWRLDGRHQWSRLRRRRDSVRRRIWRWSRAAYYCTAISRTLLFWAAFVLTRPLGATLGDFLDKPRDHGGLRSQPLSGLRHSRGDHCRPYPRHSATSGSSSRRSFTGGGRAPGSITSPRLVWFGSIRTAALGRVELFAELCGMTAICAKWTTGVDVNPPHGSASWLCSFME